MFVPVIMLYIEEMFKKYCKECRHVKCKSTMTKWHVQKQTNRKPRRNRHSE